MSKTQLSYPQDDGRVFHDMAPEGNPCFECGACCRHYRVSFYQGEISTQPGGFVPEQYVQPVTPFIVCMRGTETGGGRCIALRDDGRCDIYAHRPSACREFRAFLDDGTMNPECVRLRKLYGIDIPST